MFDVVLKENRGKILTRQSHWRTKPNTPLDWRTKHFSKLRQSEWTQNR